MTDNSIDVGLLILVPYVNSKQLLHFLQSLSLIDCTILIQFRGGSCLVPKTNVITNICICIKENHRAVIIMSEPLTGAARYFLSYYAQ